METQNISMLHMLLKIGISINCMVCRQKAVVTEKLGAHNLSGNYVTKDQTTLPQVNSRVYFGGGGGGGGGGRGYFCPSPPLGIGSSVLLI